MTAIQNVTMDTVPIAMDIMIEMVSGIPILIIHITMTCHRITPSVYFATEMIMHHQTAGRRILDVLVATV